MAGTADLDRWLAACLPASATPWLADRLAAIAAGDHRALAIALGHAGRRAGDGPMPAGAPPWTAAQAVRVRLVLAVPAADRDAWLAALDRVFATAALEELVALYQGLPLLPHPLALVPRARAGIRHSATPVFAAVALGNAYPAAHLPGETFAQMVLKAFFLGADVDRIVGLEARADRDLGRMLVAYARERRAAGRTIDHRLWRVVGLAAGDEARAALDQAAVDGDPEERAAARAARARLTGIRP